MDWAVAVNDMLRDDITKLNSTMMPPGYKGDVRNVRSMQESLSKLIDHLGVQSAKAQQLGKVITSAEKMRKSPTYFLYLLKDRDANGGKGEVIGMLKVGRKHLFLYDERARVREVDPLCVLDFYVVRDRQREGHGRRLFDHMMEDMATPAHLLAVDGPSHNMEQFLSKNYGMGRLVRHNNNFAVSPQFFDNNLEDIGQSTCSTPVETPSVGRFSAPKPHSSVGDVIHGGAPAKAPYSASSAVSVEDEASALELVEPVAAPEPLPSPEPVVEQVLEPRGLERPSTLQVETAASALPSPAAPSPAGSCVSRRDSQLTEKGFFDVKFYHNKLW